MEQRNEGFYRSLRRRIERWIESKGQNHKYADYLFLAPDLFHVIARLIWDKRVSATDKASLAGAVAYFISPIDLVPEAIVGTAGYIDDVALAAFVLNRFINEGNEEITREHWAGDEDVVKVVQRVIELADELLATGVWRRIKEFGEEGPGAGQPASE